MNAGFVRGPQLSLLSLTSSLAHCSCTEYGYYSPHRHVRQGFSLTTYGRLHLNRRERSGGIFIAHRSHLTAPIRETAVAACRADIMFHITAS